MTIIEYDFNSIGHMISDTSLETDLLNTDYNYMTILESNICTIAEWMKSNEIEALISELQMIADRKYSEEEEIKIYQEAWIAFVDNYLKNLNK